MKYITLCLLFISPFALFSQSLDIPLLTISGTAEVYVPVDEVHFSIGISHNAPIIADARKQNVAESEKVVNILKAKGVPSKYIQTKRMSLGRNYIKHSKKKEWDGFIASQTIYVCLLDPSKYDEIAEEFLAMDIASLNGPTYKSSKAVEAMEEARTKAILIAKDKAEQLVGALGQTLGPAKIIKENVVSNGNANTYSAGTSLVTDVESGSKSFETGQMVIRSGVTVSFELRE